MPYADPLTDAELAAALAGLPDWTRDGAVIRRTVRLAGFREAAELVGALAEIADAADHHPDVCITRYRQVSFELTTHAANAITRRDIDLAAAIDELVRDRGAGAARIGGA